MEFGAVARRLRIAEDAGEQALAALSVGWEASQESRPADGCFFLQPDFIQRASDAASLPEEALRALLGAAERVAADSALAAVAWHCHWAVYLSDSYALPAPSQTARDSIRHWPLLRSSLGDDAGLFYLLVCLAGLRLAAEVHTRHHVPEVVVRDTLSDVIRWADREYRAEQGCWGLYPRRLTWLRNHFRGELYHLVRLQFQFGRLWPGFTFCRHRQTGGVAAVAEDGALVDSTAQLAAPEIHLSEDEWERVLAPGDPVLHLHIPSGSPMDFDACGASFQEALRFFPEHFPVFPFKAIACSSWLLDPTLAELMPPHSNIARFQREVYLLPSRSSGQSTMERVFGTVPTTREEIAALPRDTTLRRVIVDHLLTGGQIGSGRCVLFPQDLRWGSQVYRHAPHVAD